MDMEYYKFAGGSGFEYVRLDRVGRHAWLFDEDDLDWIESDAHYTEIVWNGGGEEVTEAEAVKAVGILQSA